MCVAGERLKPQRSPTRKRWLPVFPHFNQRATCVPAVQRMRSGCAADAQRMRSGCAADAGVKTTLMDWGGGGAIMRAHKKKIVHSIFFLKSTLVQ